MGGFGLFVVFSIVLVAFTAEILAPYNPIEQHPGHELLPPSAQYWLGSDQFGRDIFSRIIFGARISLMVGIIAVAIGASVGIVTGLIAGYLGGWVDSAIMRSYDALLAFPGILIAIAVITVLGPGSLNVAYALAIGGMPGTARVMRSLVLSQRERDYVLAARCLGANDKRIMWRHIFPNCFGPLLVQVSLMVGYAVLAEASLSFLGLGSQPPQPSWGGMLNESRAYLRVAPWFGIWPGVAIALLVVGLNYLTDALRDLFDPRQKIV
jgi:peptide/nickel transport system permease protein